MRKIDQGDKGEEYIRQMHAFKAYKQNARNKLKQTRYDASKDYRANNKEWFKILDLFAILCILMNFGALLITNALVVKVDPDRNFVEGNPTQCAWNGYSCHEEAASIIIPILKQMLLWAIIAFAYIYMRNNTFNITGLWILTLIIAIYSIMLGFDFINDLGYYIGKILWGV